ncbi:MAG: DNA mismatch repair protein MutS [Clostridia bacterium]|nr:DNA mismatch repair protein MutS [Clostridia bacterium]
MGLTPMMSHYMSIKENYKDCILLYRLGDFYEMFFDDAVTVSKVLDLTLTGRDCGQGARAPMCGMPYHAVDNYISKLVANGYKVAICEQLSDPSQTPKGGMVERDVVRVITAGTLTEESMLDERSSNYLASVHIQNGKVGLAWCDVSTGGFYVCEEDYTDAILQDLLVSCAPSQIISNEEVAKIADNYNIVINGDIPRFEQYFEWTYNFDKAYKLLTKQLNVSTLISFECEDKPCAICAAGALMQYLLDTQKTLLSHIDNIKLIRADGYLYIDSNTKRNLELLQTMKDHKRYGSLLWVLDKTCTPMGARNIKNWILRPLYNDKAINYRLNAIEELIALSIVRDDLFDLLKNIRDIERLSSKIAYRTISPKDCLSIRDSLSQIPHIKSILSKLKSPMLKDLYKKLDSMLDVKSLLDDAIDDNAPHLVKDGKYIKAGYCKELDELRDIYNISNNWLTDLEIKEKESTGIKNLKISYNKVFGYYIEVTKSFLELVPSHYIRKQTTANSERYFTEELKIIEDKVLHSQENALALEAKLFGDVKEKLIDCIHLLKSNAEAIGDLDSILSLANVAIENNYVKPNISAKNTNIEILDGRHPVVEKILKSGAFVSNNTLLDADDNRTMVITGPNMAGKSTYMRQVALITLMAHIGSYVPCKSATISLIDRIFTRVGASDDLTTGQSTFMVEMTEVATILKNATSKSLIILDEIGRGTSTYDGLSIAWAVMEYVCNVLKAKTLFATHYHELTMLEGILTGVRNYRVTVKELADTVIFLHKIARGGANRSFGIEVASLAGVPKSVTTRAKEILSNIVKNKGVNDTNSIMIDGMAMTNSTQISMFEPDSNAEVINIIKELNMDNVTPMQAFETLYNLHKKLN